MSEWIGGKGSTQRKVDQARFDAEFDRIFGKKKEKRDEEQLILPIVEQKDLVKK